MEAWHLFPLGSALGYTVAALFMRQASQAGVGPWRTAFASNLAMAVLYAPLLFWAEFPDSAMFWVRALTAGATFFLGQLFTFLAIHRGDVSVATPLMGTKVVFVAVISVAIYGMPLEWTLWAGAILCTVSVLLMRGDTAVERARLLPAIGFGLMSAFFYALTDVWVGRWAPLDGFALFVPVMFGSLSLWSLLLIPRFKAPFRTLPWSARKALLIGAVLMAVQALSMAWALASSGDPTTANILYSTRGIWSVALVWFAGHWFANEERQVGGAVILRRLAGALLLLLAVVLVYV